MLQEVSLFFIVRKWKWYIGTSRLLISCLILYVVFVQFIYSFLDEFELISWWFLASICSWFLLQNYNAKLSDFGLARDGPTDDKSHVSTRVMGTYGYAAPEYLSTGINFHTDHQKTFRVWFFHTIDPLLLITLPNEPISICGKGHLTAKSDIYSFGVVLLEILSGKKAIDKTRPSGEHNLVEWAKPYLTNKRRVLHVLDSRLEGQYSLSQAAKAAQLALQCLAMDARSRPNMDDVVTSLEQLQDSKEASKNEVKLHRLKRNAKTSNEPKSCKSSAEETRRATSYPRPSAYTWDVGQLPKNRVSLACIVLLL